MDNALYHHGTLGMKWGVRRAQVKLSKTNGSSKKSPSSEEVHEDYTKSHATNSVESMSDNELRNRLNRLQMEKQYTQLTQKEKSAGVKFVTNVLVGAAQQTASKYVSQYMTKGVDTLIKTVI